MRRQFKRAVATAVVIDSSPLRLQLYKPLLAKWEIDVVAVSPTLERAADLAEVSACELLVVDAGENADSRMLYRLLRRAHKRCPELVSIVLVDDADQAVVGAALAAGASVTVDRTTDMQWCGASDWPGVLGPPVGRSCTADPQGDRDPAAGCRGAVEPGSRAAALGDRPNGQVPPRELVSEARRPESGRRESVGAHPRARQGHRPRARPGHARTASAGRLTGVRQMLVAPSRS